MSFGGALFVLWRFGQRLADELPALCLKLGFLHPVIIPLTTLIVVTASHPVCGQVLNPFLGKTGKGAYNWLFVIGIVGSVLWLVFSWFRTSAPLLQVWEAVTERPSNESSAVSVTSTHPRPMLSTREEPA